MLFNGTSDATSPTTGGSTSSSRPVRVYLAPIWIFPLAAALALGCGNGVDPPEEAPPDLSGAYDVLSITLGGITFEPPNASGTFELNQDSVAGSQATGSMTLQGQVQTPPYELEDMGTYTNSLDGSWTQRGKRGGASGTYTFESDTLVVTVTDPPAVASRSVWLQR